MKHKSEFLNFIQERGYLYQCTNIEGLDQLLSKNNHIVAYIGFDCTAPSLHIGHLMHIMMLRHLQKFGYKPIVLLGGGTTKIGDPSGKDKARSFLSIKDISENISSIKKTLEKMISFDDGKTGAVIVNNADWLDSIKYIDFLRDIGIHFSVNRMLSFDSVKTRLDREQTLSFLEFNYMLLQAYDFVELNKKHGCRLQIGGSDQWGNIVNGIELGKKLNLPELFGLTTPLLLNAQGKKMGKTESGAIWLDGSMLKPYDYWQYFRNVDDQDVGRFLRFLTDVSIDEIKKLESLKDQEINEAKKVLATEVTKICHGNKEAELALSAAVSAFENEDSSLLPDYIIKKEQVASGISLVNLLHNIGFEPSKGAAKRLIQGNGCKVNDNIINDVNYIINSESFKGQSFIKLSAGKKRHVKVVADLEGKKTNFVQVRNYDTNDLSQIYLSHHKPISNLFLTLGITTFREALKYVHELPYGRNNNRTDYLSVISEKCGTCSTKHALIYELSFECEVAMTLHIAVFMMSKVNTPKISAVLNRYNLLQIPEMHCYLRYKNRIIDITFPENSASLELTEEEKIEPEHLGNYKVEKHKQFIESWLISNPTIPYNMEQIFKIRELCIKRLER